MNSATKMGLNPISLGKGSICPPRFFQNHSQTVLAKTFKLCDFKFLPSDTFLKNIPVNDIAASYNDVINKNGGANFIVISLLN